MDASLKCGVLLMQIHSRGWNTQHGESRISSCLVWVLLHRRAVHTWQWHHWYATDQFSQTPTILSANFHMTWLPPILFPDFSKRESLGLIGWGCYMQCLRKTIYLTFDHNFDNCRPTFKILSLTFPRKLWVTIAGSFTSPYLCYYTTLRNSRT